LNPEPTDSTNAIVTPFRPSMAPVIERVEDAIITPLVVAQ
jgi:hypothetical protein